MLNMPDWMTPHPTADGTDRPGWFVIDPDKAYPEWLGLLGIDAPDQFDMEVAYQCIKLDAQLYARVAGALPEHGTLHLTIRGAEGYKARWAAATKPPGKLADVVGEHGDGALKRVGLHARDRYRAIRGMLPG